MKSLIITLESSKEVEMTPEEIAEINESNRKSDELRQQHENERLAKEDLKASAKAKLIAGEKLTEEEANILVGV